MNPSVRALGATIHVIQLEVQIGSELRIPKVANRISLVAIGWRN